MAIFVNLFVDNMFTRRNTLACIYQS